MFEPVSVSNAPVWGFYFVVDCVRVIPGGIIQKCTNGVRKFCEADDRELFHGPKNRAIGVINEASELLEHFRFLSEEQALELLKNK